MVHSIHYPSCPTPSQPSDLISASASEVISVHQFAELSNLILSNVEIILESSCIEAECSDNGSDHPDSSSYGLATAGELGEVPSEDNGGC